MLGPYYYHQIIRKTIIGFGTLFNQIYIRHQDSNNSDISDIKVPLSYGPAQKFLAKIRQQEDLSKPVAITLPRMSFEMTSLAYDATRKTGITQSFKAVDSENKIKRVYMPVPYNIGFELSVMAKLNDDALQIVEQILPAFQPGFNITIDLIDSIGEKRDVPIILNNISFQDDYEGDFSTRRSIVYTFYFVAKVNIFGPVSDNSDGLIRKVQVDTYSGLDKTTAKREMRYTLVPDPIDAEPDDDFGFSETIENFYDSRSYSPTQQADI